MKENNLNEALEELLKELRILRGSMETNVLAVGEQIQDIKKIVHERKYEGKHEGTSEKTN